MAIVTYKQDGTVDQVTGNTDSQLGQEAIASKPEVSPIVRPSDFTAQEFKMPEPVVSTEATGLLAQTEGLRQIQRQSDLERQVRADAFSASEKKLTGVMEKLGLRGQRQAKLEDEQNIDEKTIAINEINKQIDSKSLEYRRRIEKIQADGSLTKEQAAPQVREIERKAAQELADLSIIQSARNNDLLTAQSIVDRKIKLEFEPLEQQLEFQKFFYENNKDLFSAADQRAFQVKMASDEREYAERKEAFTTLQATKLEAIKEALANGADNATLLAIQSAKTPEEALMAAGEYYGLLDRQEATNKLTSLPPAIQTKVQTIANQFDGEQAVKSYQKLAEAKGFIDSIDPNTSNPQDDQGLIYAFAKAMDPDSVVREGEYATVQKYAQTWADQLGVSAKRLLSNEPLLTPEARENIKKTVTSRHAQSEKAYQNVYSEYGRRINKITGSDDGIEYITDYSKPFTENSSGGLTDEERNIVEQMRKDNPGIPDDVIEQVIGKPLSFNNVGGGTANAQKIAKAIKTVESQGNYSARGASGEFGAYQFMPSTWKQWAGEFLGNPNAPMTPQNQDRVAIAKINSLIKQGYNPQQIALIWNGGTPKVKKGVNSKGVKYDSGAYARKVIKTLNG